MAQHTAALPQTSSETPHNMVTSQPPVEFKSTYDEGRSQTFWGRTSEKTKSAPWFPLGLAGFTGIGLYGIVNYMRNKSLRQADGASKTLYWTKLRVMAQGFAVGIIGIGFVVHLLTGDDDKKSPYNRSSRPLSDHHQNVARSAPGLTLAAPISSSPDIYHNSKTARSAQGLTLAAPISSSPDIYHDSKTARSAHGLTLGAPISSSPDILHDTRSARLSSGLTLNAPSAMAASTAK